MMSFLNAARIIAGILLIACIAYFIATRGGNVDVPMPWGQSATMEIPPPVSQPETPETRILNESERIVEAVSSAPASQIVSSPPVREYHEPTPSTSVVGIWRGDIYLDSVRYEDSAGEFFELEFYDSGEYAISLGNANLPFSGRYQASSWVQNESGEIDWRVHSDHGVTIFHGRIVEGRLEGRCENPSCRFRFQRVPRRFADSARN